jgi:hypothetical protein|eukprot:COSAG06_NODE_1406_length_9552_cov_7.866286_5_plen_120_part_00
MPRQSWQPAGSNRSLDEIDRCERLAAALMKGQMHGLRAYVHDITVLHGGRLNERKLDRTSARGRTAPSGGEGPRGSSATRRAGVFGNLIFRYVSLSVNLRVGHGSYGEFALTIMQSRRT